MKVTYLEPAVVGPLWGHGRVVKRGGTISFVEADLVDADGTIIARATATVRMITLPSPG
jgi:acyl-coenzyme A thioesterase PaaI-like protein